TQIAEVPRIILRRSSGPPPPLSPSLVPPAPDTVESLEDVERRAVERALAAFEGNVLQAAKALGVARGTLYRKMERYGLR
ncbi:MAG: helix-turn-helix domain-containing protein, partial [Sandaracinaceae bacterium]